LARFEAYAAVGCVAVAVGLGIRAGLGARIALEAGVGLGVRVELRVELPVVPRSVRSRYVSEGFGVGWPVGFSYDRVRRRVDIAAALRQLATFPVDARPCAQCPFANARSFAVTGSRHAHGLSARVVDGAGDVDDDALGDDRALTRCITGTGIPAGLVI